MTLTGRGFTRGVVFLAVALFVLSSGVLAQENSSGEGIPGDNMTYVIPDSVSLADLLANWGVCGNASECVYDFNNDSEIGELDLAVFLALWNRTIDERYLANSPDINNDGLVDGLDLAELLAQWGECENCTADIYADGVVDSVDEGILIAFWKGIDVEIFSPIGIVDGNNVSLEIELNVQGNYSCFYDVYEFNGLEIIGSTEMDCSSTSFIIDESGNYTLNLYIKRNGFLIFQKAHEFQVVIPASQPDSPEESSSSSNGSSSSGGGSCITDWVCGEWSACTNEVQTRTCAKAVGFCYANPDDKPQESRVCEIVEVEDEVPQVQNGGAASALTGAVVGVFGDATKSMAALLIVLVIATAWLAMVMINKKGYFDEEVKATEKKNVKVESKE